MRTSCRLLALCFLVGSLSALLAGCAPLRPHELNTGWIEVRSEHFEVMSRLDEEETTALVRDLEHFRSAVLMLTSITRPEPRLPTRIYLFDSPGAFAPFSAGKSVLGYFTQELRANYAALYGVRSKETSDILLHEYTHFLLRNENGVAYPKWYDEGMAEFLSTLEVEGNEVVLGRIPKARVQQFNYTTWISMRRILTAKFESWTPLVQGMFYAESWALVHYLMMQSATDASITKKLAVYFEELRASADAEAALERAFGMSTVQLDRALRTYLGRGRLPAYTITFDFLPSPKPPQVRALPPADVATHLGQLSLVLEQGPQAQAFFEVALEAAPESSRALAGLGGARKRQGDWAQARVLLERAVELDPNDALNQLDLAEYWHDLAVQTKSAAERASAMERARRHYVRSHHLDPEIPETYWAYGRSFADQRENLEKAVEMLEYAHELLPGNEQIRLTLAQVYLEAGRAEEARNHLLALLVYSHSGSFAETAKELLERAERSPDGVASDSAQ